MARDLEAGTLLLHLHLVNGYHYFAQPQKGENHE